MHWTSSSAVSSLVLRVSVGLSMIFIGITEYRDFSPFVANMTDGLGVASMLGTVWAYVFPALLVFGGGLLAIGRYPLVAAWTGGVALASVPAGMLLKTVMTGLPLPDMLATATPALVWLVVFYFALNPFPEAVESGQ